MIFSSEKITKIARMPLFDGFSCEELVDVLEGLGACEHEYEKNQVVVMEGDDAVFFGLVLEGSVSIVRNDYFGNRNIMLTLEAPAMFGEAIACTGQPKYSVSVISEGIVRILIIPNSGLFGDAVRIDVATKNRLYLNMMRIMARKNLMFRQKVDLLSQRSTREKLMYYLNAQAIGNGSDMFEIPYDRQELADYLGVERSALSAVIGQMRDEGIIESRKRLFRLL